MNVKCLCGASHACPEWQAVGDLMQAELGIQGELIQLACEVRHAGAVLTADEAAAIIDRYAESLPRE